MTLKKKIKAQGHQWSAGRDSLPLSRSWRHGRGLGSVAEGWKKAMDGRPYPPVHRKARSLGAADGLGRGNQLATPPPGLHL